jgi:hypothetical protein
LRWNVSIDARPARAPRRTSTGGNARGGRPTSVTETSTPGTNASTSATRPRAIRRTAAARAARASGRTRARDAVLVGRLHDERASQSAGEDVAPAPQRRAGRDLEARGDEAATRLVLVVGPGGGRGRRAHERRPAALERAAHGPAQPSAARDGVGLVEDGVGGDEPREVERQGVGVHLERVHPRGAQGRDDRRVAPARRGRGVDDADGGRATHGPRIVAATRPATISRMDGPADAPPALVPGATPASARRWFVALLAIAVPFLLFRLGAKDVWEASEGRPLESAREMRATGEGLVQRTNGEVDLTKPPLYAWAARAAFAIGGDHEGVGRVPGVLAALACLGAVFVLARRGRPRAGFLAGLRCSRRRSSPGRRAAELETLLAAGVLWTFVGLDGALEATDARTRAAATLAGLAFAFAAAVKGPSRSLLVRRRSRPTPSSRPRSAPPRAVRRGRARARRRRARRVAARLRPARPRVARTLLSFARGDNVGHRREALSTSCSTRRSRCPGRRWCCSARRPRGRGLDTTARRRAPARVARSW